MAHSDDDEIWCAFTEAIHEKDRDSLLEAMCEAAHDKRYESERVSIIHRTRHNAINVTVEGVVKYEGEEYTFHLSSGDWNGTELHGWNGVGDDYEEPVPDPLSFQPRPDLLVKAYLPDGDPAFLLKKWDLFKDRADVKDLLRRYAYDSFFAPGVVIRDHYLPQFRTMGLEIVRESEATRTYERLQTYALEKSLITPLPVIAPNLPLNEF